MADNTTKSTDIVLQSDLIRYSVKYYAIVGGGFGLLTIILLNQFGDQGFSSSLVGLVFIIIIFAYTGLSGPILAALVGSDIVKMSVGDRRTRMVNNGLANAIGYIVFGFIVALSTLIGLSLVYGSGGGGGGASAAGGVDTGGFFSEVFIDFVSFIILMTIPSVFVGAGMSMISPDIQTENNNSYKKQSSQETSVSVDFIQRPRLVSMIVGGTALVYIMFFVVGEFGIFTVPSVENPLFYVALLLVLVPAIISGILFGYYKIKLLVGLMSSLTIPSIAIMFAKVAIGNVLTENIVPGIILIAIPIFLPHLSIVMGRKGLARIRNR